MSYVAKKANCFKDEGFEELLPRRSEGRLKAYRSATDARCWTDECEDRRQYILELLLKERRMSLGRYIPFEVLLELLLADLKRRLQEMNSLLTDDQKKKMGTGRSDAMKVDSTKGVQAKQVSSVKSTQAGNLKMGVERVTAADTVLPDSSDINEGVEGITAGDSEEPASSDVVHKGSKGGEGKDICTQEVQTIEAKIAKGDLSPEEQFQLLVEEVENMKVLCERLSSLEAENESLKAELEACQEEHGKEMDASICENALLKKQVESMEKEANEISCTASNYINEMACSKAKLCKVQDEMTELTATCEDITQERDWLKSHVCHLECELEKCQKDQKELQSVKDLLEELWNHHETVAKERQCLKSKVCQLQRELLTTADFETRQKLKYYDEVIHERNCLRKRVCKLEHEIEQANIATGNKEKAEGYCAKLIQKVKCYEEVVQERDCLREKVHNLELKMACMQGLPNQVKEFKKKCSKMDDISNERRSVQARLQKLQKLEEQVCKLKYECNKAAALEKQLGKCRAELRKCRKSKEAMKGKLANSEDLIENLSSKASLTDSIQEERDQLQAKVDELAHIECEYRQCLDKLRCFETIRAERDLYKAKYRELVAMESECDALREQVSNAKLIEAEKEEMMEQLGQFELCIQDQENEIQKLVMQIEKLTGGEQEQQRQVLEQIQGELNKKNQVISSSERQLSSLEEQLRQTICDMSKEVKSLKCRNKHLEKQIQQKDAEISNLRKKEGRLKDSNDCSNSDDQPSCSHKEGGWRTQSVDRLQCALKHLRNDLTVKIDTCNKLKCELDRKDEIIDKLKAFAMQKDQVNRTIHDKMEQKLYTVVEENESLRTAANEIADATGDIHLKNLLITSRAAIEKINEELCKHYTMFDKVTEKQSMCMEKLKCLKKENKKLKDCYTDVSISLEQMQYENKVLKKKSE
ncbi:girdin-like [Agrilus planipennis]|uniref:Girdin-like n=1 Tax=Agrilus planipennis TaxID=224129 RepID=A0A1W4XN95_AGRPL|nr:girdin-like [Agrilus planipennis]